MKLKPPDFSFEKKLWRKGYTKIAGIDEVGRGSWAGPVVAAAVILTPNFKVPGIADSKKLSPQRRNYFSEIIKREAIAFQIVEVGVSQVNKVGIGKSTFIAFRKAISMISPPADFVLVDAFHVPYLIASSRQQAIVKGDEQSISIAAASILAKVYRDDLMQGLSRKFPHWGFGKNKGYGTKGHQEAIKHFGLSKIHRTSFHLPDHLFR